MKKASNSGLIKLMPKLNQKGFTHLLLLIAVIAVIAFILISNTFSFKDKLFSTLFPKPSSHAVEVASGNSKTLFWGPLYFGKDFKVDEMKTVVNNLARSGFQGLNIDIDYDDHDDFLNGGASRIGDTDYMNRLQQVITYAKAVGMNDLFLRLKADTYSYDYGYENRCNSEDTPQINDHRCYYSARGPYDDIIKPPVEPGHENTYGFDVFNSRVIPRIKQTAQNEATMVQRLGLTGVWVDAEPYTDWMVWNPYAPDERKNISTRSEGEIKHKYFDLGQEFMNGLISGYPQVQLMLSPGFVNSRESYKFYPDFYAGLLSVGAQKGIIIAPEISYGYPADKDALIDVCYEMGHCDYNGADNTYTSSPGGWSPIREVLKNYDSNNGNQNLWNAHNSNTTIALSYLSRDTDGLDSIGDSIADFKSAIKNRRDLSPKYNWVYSESEYWFHGKSASCPFTAWPADLPCLGKIVADATAVTGTLTVVPTLIQQNGILSSTRVKIDWSGIPNPTPKDWVGFYPIGSTGSAGEKDWAYLNSCTKTVGSTAAAAGSCTINLSPSTFPAGNYATRFFPGGGTIQLGQDINLAIPSSNQTPVNLRIVKNDCDQGKPWVALTWDPVPDSNVKDYYVYYDHPPTGNYRPNPYYPPSPVLGANDGGNPVVKTFNRVGGDKYYIYPNNSSDTGWSNFMPNWSYSKYYISVRSYNSYTRTLSPAGDARNQAIVLTTKNCI